MVFKLATIGWGRHGKARSRAHSRIVHMARELGEAEIDEPVELAHAVTKILDQAIAEPHELAQLLGGPIRQAARRRALLGGER